MWKCSCDGGMEFILGNITCLPAVIKVRGMQLYARLTISHVPIIKTLFHFNSNTLAGHYREATADWNSKPGLKKNNKKDV